MDEDRCLVRCIHTDRVERATAAMPAADRLEQMADLFKALSDPRRLAMVAALCHESLCVCDLAAISGLSDSAASHQLRLLRAMGLVRARRKGKIVTYRLAAPFVAGLIDHVAKATASSAGAPLGGQG